eukprot:gene7815-1579_t
MRITLAIRWMALAEALRSMALELRRQPWEGDIVSKTCRAAAALNGPRRCAGISRRPVFVGGERTERAIRQTADAQLGAGVKDNEGRWMLKSVVPDYRGIARGPVAGAAAAEAAAAPEAAAPKPAAGTLHVAHAWQTGGCGGAGGRGTAAAEEAETSECGRRGGGSPSPRWCGERANGDKSCGDGREGGDGAIRERSEG